jgi:hypothetical protein
VPLQAADAIAQQEEMLKKQAATLGPDAMAVLIARNNLAESYCKVGRLSEAIAIDKDVLKRATAVAGTGHAVTLTARNNLAAVYQDAGRKDEAISLMREVVPAAAKIFGPGHPNTIRCTNRLGGLYEQAGRWADVESLYGFVRDRTRPFIFFFAGSRCTEPTSSATWRTWAGFRNRLSRRPSSARGAFRPPCTQFAPNHTPLCHRDAGRSLDLTLYSSPIAMIR